MPQLRVSPVALFATSGQQKFLLESHWPCESGCHQISRRPIGFAVQHHLVVSLLVEGRLWDDADIRSSVDLELNWRTIDEKGFLPFVSGTLTLLYCAEKCITLWLNVQCTHRPRPTHGLKVSSFRALVADCISSRAWLGYGMCTSTSCALPSTRSCGVIACT